MKLKKLKPCSARKPLLCVPKPMSFSLATSFCLASVQSSIPLMAFADPVVPSSVTHTSAGQNTNGSNLSNSSGNIQVIDISNNPVFKLTGNLSNLGTIYVISTNPQFSNATLSAKNINNLKGAQISTVIPAGGIAGFENAIPNLSLTLLALQNIVNHGLISSANNLNLAAGGRITNAPDTGAAAATAALQALGSLNVLSNMVSNQGVIASQLGSVNIANPNLYTANINQLNILNNTHVVNTLANVVNINNTGGLIQALNGSVNIGGADFGSKAIVSVLGGSVLSPALNLNAGAGSMRASLDRIDGLLNVNASMADVGTKSGALNLGTLKIDGDPTFFNNSGDVNIIGNITVQENLSILASGNILSNSAHVITTADLLGQGHDVFMAAGVNLTVTGAAVATPNVQFPGTTPILKGQIVRTAGPSLTGGSISLAGSTIDSSSHGTNQSGGKVTLVAYSNLLGSGGGVGDLLVKSGGSGTAKNGDVTIIAGGTLGALSLTPNAAVANVSIYSTGATGIKGAPNGSFNIVVAQPDVKISCDYTGTATGTVSFSNIPGKGDIVLNGLLGVVTDGGNISMSTGGKITNSSVISSNSGNFSGASAGTISLKGGSIDVQAPILASGADGADGASGLFGLPGGTGQDGGNGNSISLFGNTGILINADIKANGGKGGAGGSAALSVSGKDGAAGGGGGDGGQAGSNILLQSLQGTITQNNFVLSAIGGSAGNGGDGAASGDAGKGTAGKSGGAGGNGGDAQGGGKLTAISKDGAITLSGSLDFHGGAGGAGGQGADGSAGTAIGGIGGASGKSTAGGIGGNLTINSDKGSIDLSAATVSLFGGNGAASTRSGSGGTGATGGAAGILYQTGGGGGGGVLSISSLSGAVVLGGVDVHGGDSASQTGRSGSGGEGKTKGGAGGLIQGTGNGGVGGQVIVSTKGAIDSKLTLDAHGGTSGSITGFAGSGGAGNVAGGGGSTGNCGIGGKGGSILLDSAGAAISAEGLINATGGFGGTITALAGAGGKGLSTKGGDGGDLGLAGGGGAGGTVSLKTSNGGATITGIILAGGGFGGSAFGTAGAGGDCSGVTGGSGGDSGSAAAGGTGGTVSINASSDITVNSIICSGGAGGTNSSTAGNGGSAQAGGSGGDVGSAGAGAQGGMVTLKTNQSSLGTGLINLDNLLITASGGDGGFHDGKAGNGGTGSLKAGGAGGEAGAGGSGGKGGQISFIGLDFQMSKTASARASGGNAIGFFARSGDGGNAGVNGDGGAGGLLSSSGSGGGGGKVSLDFKHSITLTPDDNGADSLAARGGRNLANSPVSGAGGQGGSKTGKGGAGGRILINGSGGIGGSIDIKGDTGDLTGLGVIAAAGGQIFAFTPVSGKGGSAGEIGRGGDSGSITGNGSGGNGGDISISTSSGAMLLSNLYVIGADINGNFSARTGDGGRGGTVSGDGGSSGSIGSNGLGGSGGKITITTDSGVIGQVNKNAPFLAHAGVLFPNNSITGNGGDATNGKGGNSGSIGNNGRAGNGGDIFISSNSGNIITPKGTIGAAGADGGVMNCSTGNGGSTLKGSGGNSGDIGANSSGGDAGFVSISSISGNITIDGVIVIPGGLALGNTSKTGNGGSSGDSGSTGGNGGNSGKIGIGGNGGKGGNLSIILSGDFTGGEAIVANGGDAAGSIYSPVTGNGGNGSILGKGGSSGSIGDAGRAGDGGFVLIKSSNGSLNPDRVLVFGGRGGTDATPSFLPDYVPHHPAYSGTMFAVSGNGGSGLMGGEAGTIGMGVIGGDGGTINASAAKGMPTTVEWSSYGGNGGAQSSLGGNGGNGVTTGGAGADVKAGGNGGGGGQITLTSTKGDIIIRALYAYGGNGGFSTGIGGVGGNSGGPGKAGAGGDSIGSGAGGGGGKTKIEIINSGSKVDFTGTLNKGVLDTVNLSGGAAGDMSGIGGNGGNGTGTLSSLGGAGGAAGDSGAGGNGGTIELRLKGSKVLFSGDSPNISINGGNSGVFAGQGGNGGIGTGSLSAGKGGDTATQGKAGNGGTLSFDGGDFKLDSGKLISANGGIGLAYLGIAGDGGHGSQDLSIGGADGGAGGNVGTKGFSAGAGGNGGKIELIASGSLTLDGTISANGGDRLSVDTRSGNGGDAGFKSLLSGTGGSGGDGGAILPVQGAGFGGSLIIKSSAGTLFGSGTFNLNGGNVVISGIMRSGNGGVANYAGRGGNGGAIGNFATAGGGGALIVQALGAVGLSGSININGGSVQGSSWVVISGSGANANSVAGGDAGKGGDVGFGGSGYKAGLVDISSLLGPISIGKVFGNGGSSGTTLIATGNGGSQLAGKGAGGSSGKFLGNGKGGDGGSVIIASVGAISQTDDWQLNGGSVGSLIAKSGNGGSAFTKAGGGGAGVGGNSGAIGANGDAGSGGSIDIQGNDLPVTLNAFITMNGGNTGNYFGIGGDGGNGIGKSAGGDSGALGAAGRSGNGGSISVVNKGSGTITVSKDINLNAGKTSLQQGLGGNGGAADVAGGQGGDIGAAAMGGDGGKMTLWSKAAGSISLVGNFNAIGATGGDNKGLAGDGGIGVFKGGIGGAIGFGGEGGKGGELTLLSKSSDVTVTAAQINLNGGAGGVQFGVGGKGGAATDKTNQSSGFSGGDIAFSGSGGKGGIIDFEGGNSVSSSALILANGGAGADNNGIAGMGGVGFIQGGRGGAVSKSGSGGGGGSVTMKSDGDITVSSAIQLNGAIGGDQKGKGGLGISSDGSSAGTGGDGGSVEEAGAGGSGGFMIFVGNSIGLSDLSLNGAAGGGNFGTAGAAGNGAVAGGKGGSVSKAGAGGSGGGMIISADSDLTFTNVSSVGGVGGLQQGVAAAAGTALSPRTGTGGQGGTIGSGGTGGDAGGHGLSLILITAKGDITFNNSWALDGGVGGANKGTGGAGGEGTKKGGDGGMIDVSGSGGSGGNISISSDKHIMTAGSGTFAASGADGGLQDGKAGKGADGETGGLGGKVRTAGDGGAGGNISITSAKTLTLDYAITANGGIGGASTGVAGNGGGGSKAIKGLDGGTIEAAGRGGMGGIITLKGDKGLTLSQPISLNGGDGGARTGTAGNGGDALLGTAGNGGNVAKSGDGGNSGIVTLSPGVITPPVPQPGKAGFASPTGQGAGGTGKSPAFNGKNGTNFGAGSDGKVSLLFDWRDDSDEHDLKKRKLRNNTFVALENPSVKYSDLIFVPEADASTEMKEIGFVQVVPTVSPATIVPSTALSSLIPNMVTSTDCSDELLSSILSDGAIVHKESGSEHFSLQQGSLLLAPDKREMRVRTPHGVAILAPGSQAILEVSSSATTVRTLHDHKQGDVRFAAGDRNCLEVNLGRQLCISRNHDYASRDFERASKIAIRNLKTISLPCGLVAHQSEFSLAAAMGNHRSLRALANSKQHQHRKQYDLIAKNACVLFSLGAKQGPYKQ